MPVFTELLICEACLFFSLPSERASESEQLQDSKTPCHHETLGSKHKIVTID